MRDPRFPARSTFWSDLIAQGRLVEGEIWFSSLVDQLHQALQDTRCFEKGEEFSFLRPRIEVQLTALRLKRGTIPADFLNALEASFEPRSWDAMAAQAAWCWGSALGRNAPEARAAQDLQDLLAKASHDFVMREAFLEYAGQLLYQRHPSLVTAVEESVERLIKDPASFILGGRGEGFSEALDRWWKLPPYEAFDLQALERVPLHYEFLGLIDQLRKIDKRAYLDWLERLRNPVLVEHAFLTSDSLEDFDELLTLLEAAAPAYGDEECSGWVAMSAPLLLVSALHHAQTLLAPFSRPDRDEEVYRQLCGDLSGRMQRLALGLAQRKDGARLVAHWLMRLVRIKTQLNGWLALPASMAINALVQVFGDCEENAAAVIQWLPSIVALSPDEERDLRLSGLGRTSTSLTPRMDILIARLYMKAFRHDTKDFESEIGIFDNLLLVRDAGLFTDPSQSELATWRHQLVGPVLKAPDLVSKWKECWNALEEQRRRTRHTAFTLDRTADEASLFLSSAALSLLEGEGDAVRLNAPMGLQLWNVVYESVWSMALLYGSQAEGEVWRYLLTLFMRALPKHLDLASDYGSDRLSELLAAFACDEELVTHSLGRLSQAGSRSIC